MYPAMLVSLWTHLRTTHAKSQSPYLTYYNGFYMLVFSAIPHKELRFLLPILPFAFLMIAEFLTQQIKHGSRLASWSIKLFFVVEVITNVVFTMFHQRDWEWAHYLTSVKPGPVHSVYTMERFGAPYYSWFHGTST